MKEGTKEEEGEEEEEEVGGGAEEGRRGAGGGNEDTEAKKGVEWKLAAMNVSDGKEEESREAWREEGKEGGREDVPEDYLCPLSLSLFEDPVIAMDGISYSRGAIQAHLDFCREKGKVLTSPMTGERMEGLLVPNVMARRMVLEYLERSSRWGGGEGEGGRASGGEGGRGGRKAGGKTRS
jgi:hypothetical protein